MDELELDIDIDWQSDIDFNLSDFSLLDETDGITDTRYQKPKTYSNIKRRVMYEHAIDFAKDIEFERGMHMFAFVSGNFIFGDLFEALVEIGKINIKTMMLQTLSVSQENIDSLRNLQLMCPDMERMDLVLSAYFYSHELSKTEGLVPYLYEQLDHGDILQVAFGSIHSKIVTIETVAGNKLVFHGSANMRSSRNVEHICIEQDDGLFDFIEGFGKRIIEAYGTIDKSKPVRGGELWQAVQERAEEKAERSHVRRRRAKGARR